MLQSGMAQGKCSALKDDGSSCNSPSQVDGVFCFFHDPNQKQKRKESQSRGGAPKSLKSLHINCNFSSISTPQEIINILTDTIHHVRTGQLDPRIANCVGYLSGIALKAIEQGKTEERIEALEAAVKNNKSKAEKDFRQDDGQLFSFENRG